MALRMTVLGCSGVYASPDNACSGYLLQTDEVNVLVEAGAGILGTLQSHLPLQQLDAVVVSHSHPDHWVEVPILRNALRYVLGGGGLPLHAPAEVLRMASSVAHEHLAPTLEPHRITDTQVLEIGDLTISCSRTQHPPETLALCVQHDGRALAYSADTGPAWGFTEFGVDLDLAVCEATFREADGPHDPVHMTAAQAGAAAAEAGARSLLITHLVPGAEVGGARAEAESAYGSRVDVARPGLVVEL